ncbi:MAG: aminodeoxychorismate/anthranilate synthase component II [Saprospiraceae bacterium]|nr:aminodeoxychorismate/anthranilate synthase component II [Saprospiraceae bacterium]
MTKILLIDHQDSFTHNIAQLLEEAGAEVNILTYQSDLLNKVKDYSYIVLSPGPGTVNDIPETIKLIQNCPDNCSILGICLGMQAIAYAYGCRLFRQTKVKHGQKVSIFKKKNLKPNSVLYNMPNPFEAGLYHSWAVKSDTISPPLEITALSSDGIVMGLKHKSRKIEGVQFHPESFLCTHGILIIQKWIESE